MLENFKLFIFSFIIGNIYKIKQISHNLIINLIDKSIYKLETIAFIKNIIYDIIDKKIDFIESNSYMKKYLI